jgi:hypothetical protein
MRILGQGLLTLFSTKRSQGTTERSQGTTEPQMRSGPSLQPKPDASGFGQSLGHSRGGDFAQTRARMGFGEGIPPSRDRD